MMIDNGNKGIYKATKKHTKGQEQLGTTVDSDI